MTGRQEQVDRLFRLVHDAASHAAKLDGAERELFLRGHRASSRMAANGSGLDDAAADEWARTVEAWVRKALTLIQRHGPLSEMP